MYPYWAMFQAGDVVPSWFLLLQLLTLPETEGVVALRVGDLAPHLLLVTEPPVFCATKGDAVGWRDDPKDELKDETVALLAVEVLRAGRPGLFKGPPPVGWGLITLAVL